MELTPEEEQQFFATPGDHYVSDLLRFKGIQPDSGLVRVKSGRSIITVTTESDRYGYGYLASSNENPSTPES